MFAVFASFPLVLMTAVGVPVQPDCGVQPVAPTAAEAPALEAFTQRITAYMQVREEVERTLPVRSSFDDAEDLFEAIEAMPPFQVGAALDCRSRCDSGAGHWRPDPHAPGEAAGRVRAEGRGGARVHQRRAITYRAVSTDQRTVPVGTGVGHVAVLHRRPAASAGRAGVPVC